MSLKMILAAPVPALADAFERNFSGLPNVEVHRGPFESIQQFDAMVSAANSFGLMDGGVDLAISEFFGWQLMHRVQERIATDFLGEQPVGTAFTIHTGNDDHPWLIHAPTMRVPEITAGTDSTYRATWAALLSIHQHNKVAERKIESVVFPGMGTGCGMVLPNSAAQQMALAWRHYTGIAMPITWPNVTVRAYSINTAAVNH